MVATGVTRCELACGHTAFALPREASQIAHGFYFCYAHSAFQRIVTAEPLEPGPRPTAKLRRHAVRKRTIEP